MAGEIFRKTESGLAALRSHGALEPRWRTLMVLVNGERTVEDLSTQLGTDPRPALLQLRELGLIELIRRVVGPAPAAPRPVAPPPTAAARPSSPAAPLPQPAPPPAAQAPVPPANEAALLRARQVQALDMLHGYFGPGADDLAAPLLQARSLAAFREALGPLQEKLAVYQGKKRAAELIRPLIADA